MILSLESLAVHGAEARATLAGLGKRPTDITTFRPINHRTELRETPQPEAPVAFNNSYLIYSCVYILQNQERGRGEKGGKLLNTWGSLTLPKITEGTVA